MVLFLAGLQTIPRSYYEAAEIDGATAWSKFRRITLLFIADDSVCFHYASSSHRSGVRCLRFVSDERRTGEEHTGYYLISYENAFQPV